MGQMMVPFESVGLPAHITGMQGISGDDLTAGTGGGFPVISIKGKVFHISRGDDKQLVTRSDGSGEPASSIEVVILRANPALSKTYYATGFEEGSTEKPTCYSEDGIAPAADAAEKQSVKCQTCPHNQWGSRVTESSSKGKACADVRRLAVAPVGAVNDPMLLRVPPASLKVLGAYGDMLKKRGVQYPAVATKISFDFSVSHPALTFTPMSFITEEMAKTVAEMRGSDMVVKILGMQNAAATQVPGNVQAALPAPVQPSVQPAPVTPQPVPVQATVQKAAPKPVPAKKAAAPVSAASSAFSSAPVVPSAPQPAAKAPSAQASKLVEVNTGDLDAELSAVLASAGFDDQ